MKNKRGSIFFLSLVITYSLMVTGYVMTLRTMTESRASHLSAASHKAFSLAESGVDNELVRLRDGTTGAWDSCGGDVQQYQNFSYRVECVDNNTRRIISTGVSSVGNGWTATRTVEVYGQRIAPAGFYDSADTNTSTVCPIFVRSRDGC